MKEDLKVFGLAVLIALFTLTVFALPIAGCVASVKYISDAIAHK